MKEKLKEKSETVLIHFASTPLDSYWMCTRDCVAEAILCPEGFCEANNECAPGREAASYGECGVLEKKNDFFVPFTFYFPPNHFLK